MDQLKLSSEGNILNVNLQTELMSQFCVLIFSQKHKLLINKLCEKICDELQRRNQKLLWFDWRKCWKCQTTETWILWSDKEKKYFTLLH